MTQSQFMYELMKELDGIPDESKYIIMNDYSGYFSEQEDKGLSVDDIIAKLGSPEKIALSYKNGVPVLPEEIGEVTDKGNRTPLSVLKFILMIPAAALYVPLTASLGLVMFSAAAVLCVASIALSVYAFSALSLSFGFIIVGIGGVLFTFSFVMLCVTVCRLAVRMVTAFPKYMGRVLNNTEKSVELI